MPYHVSAVSGLTVLKPQVSSHGKAYVYAAENLVTGLLFGAPHDDFDFLIDEDAGRPALYECYPHAFDAVFEKRACSVYEVPSSGFQKETTCWSAELVCETEVPVLKEWRVPNLRDRLLEEAARNRLTLNRFEDTVDYKRMISEHIVDRLIRFDALERLETDARFQAHYRRIIEALRAAMDGRLLE